MAKRVTLAACTVLLLSALTGTGDPRVAAVGAYTITELSRLGPGESLAQAINTAGQVVGWAQGAFGTHAVLWRDGAITDLGTLPGGRASLAGKINDRGQVVGEAATADGTRRAVLWRDGAIADLGTLGGSTSRATGINATGQVTGFAITADGTQRAFLWQGGAMADLGTLGGSRSVANDINDAGQVVGEAQTAAGDFHAFLWQGGAMTDLGTLGGRTSTAWAINAAGQVVGGADTAGGRRHAFLWQGGVMTDLGTLPGSAESIAYDINNKGQVVGNTVAPSREPRGAILWQGGTPTDLNSLLPPGSGWELLAARGINDVGQIVGWGTLSGPPSRSSYLLTPTAMPGLPSTGSGGGAAPRGTAPLVALGLLALLGLLACRCTIARRRGGAGPDATSRAAAP